MPVPTDGVPAPPATPLIAVTDHAAERFRQRVGGRNGELDVKLEIVERVGRAWAAGRVEDRAPDGASGARGSRYVRDLVDRGVVFVCRPAGPELIVVTLWEEQRAAGSPRVARRFTDALKTDDHVVAERRRDRGPR